MNEKPQTKTDLIHVMALVANCSELEANHAVNTLLLSINGINAADVCNAMSTAIKTEKPAYLSWLESINGYNADGKSPNGYGTRWQSASEHAQKEHEQNEYLKYGHTQNK